MSVIASVTSVTATGTSVTATGKSVVATETRDTSAGKIVTAISFFLRNEQKRALRDAKRNLRVLQFRERVT